MSDYILLKPSLYVLVDYRAVTKQILNEEHHFILWFCLSLLPPVVSIPYYYYPRMK